MPNPTRTVNGETREWNGSSWVPSQAPSPIYKDSTGRWTNLPGPDMPKSSAPSTDYGRGSTDPVAQTGWEGQHLLDDAKQEAFKKDSVTNSLDSINQMMFPKASAAKAADPTKYQNMVSSSDYAQVDKHLQDEEAQAKAQNTVGAKVVGHLPPWLVDTAAAAATPFVGPGITIPAAMGANASLDMLRSHYRDPNAPQSGGDYLGDMAGSVAAPLAAAGTEAALSKLPAVLSKPGLIPGAIGAVHGYSRGGVMGALEEGAGGYYAGKLFGGLGSLQRAAGFAVPEAEAAAAGAGAEATAAEAAPEAAAAAKTRRSTEILMHDPNAATWGNSEKPENSVNDVLKNMGGRYADRKAGFSPDMVESLNAPKYPVKLDETNGFNALDDMERSQRQESFDQGPSAGSSLDLLKQAAGGGSYDARTAMDPNVIDAGYARNRAVVDRMRANGLFGGDRNVRLKP